MWKIQQAQRICLYDGSNSFLINPNIPKLSEEQRASCEGRISKDECKKALETFEAGKTPGNDGIPAEFYKTFWDSLDDYLIDVFNLSFEYEEMSNSQGQAIITLLDKKGRDRTFLENWRPISLINVDAKIASKAIANRMKQVLPEIIHHNQSGFVKNRFIGETARSISLTSCGIQRLKKCQVSYCLLILRKLLIQ